ncbi:MAG: ABC transporter permease [Anaerolineales bacterium]|nr:MAG: ABC transporter permease [Anaerolineales bacterium]
MSLHRTLAIMRKECLHIIRDPRTLFLVTLSPAFLLFTLTYVLTFDVQQVSYAVLDQDRSELSRRYVAGLVSEENVSLAGYVSSYSEVDGWFLRRQASAVVVIPPGFQADLGRRRSAQIQVILDGTDPVIARDALARVRARTQGFIVLEELGPVSPSGAALASTLPVDVRLRIWYNPGERSLFSLVPGLLGMVLIMPTLSSAVALAREKEMGTLEQLLVTPMGRAEFWFGKMIPYVISGLLSCFLAIIMATVWFKVPFRGNVLVFGLLTLDLLVATMGLSLLMASFVSSQQAAMIGNFLIFFLPSFFLSGLYQPVPREISPSTLASYSLPTTYFVTIARGVLLKGVGLAELWPEALVLAVLGGVSLGLGIGLFRKKLR